ncbi:hypothetical protein QJS83_14980 [Bdellovibrio sp. 22V]|uniref:hypothetical protein n=1 Tax=Bdellovibrio sp. 22V TaxID=3044166 RepID=UPI0025430AEB|nr:hypothetical protein [Bdellovibrio sp. 22V]WII71767.1 hypothetical protein QJS83_14980 [Bdellovibrio sp. 22V]
MAQFDFNAIKQAVHDAHAESSDPHAQPSDVQYIDPRLPEAAIINNGAFGKFGSQNPSLAQTDAMLTYPGAGDVVVDYKTGPEVVSGSPDSSDIMTASVAASKETLQRRAYIDDLPTSNSRGADTPLECTPGITIHNCPLLVWLAVARLDLDGKVTAYAFERDTQHNIYLRPFSPNANATKLKIDVPLTIPYKFNDDFIVVTSEVLKGARLELYDILGAAEHCFPEIRQTMNLALAGKLSGRKDSRDADKRVRVERVSTVPPAKVKMFDALYHHIIKHGFRMFGSGRKPIYWDWRHDANGRFPALGYDGKTLTYSYDVSQALESWDGLEFGRVNLAEFTQSNNTRVSSHDYVTIADWMFRAANLALKDGDARAVLFDAANGNPEHIKLVNAFIDMTPGVTYHHNAANMIAGASHDAAWHNVIRCMMIGGVLLQNAQHSEQDSLIVTESIFNSIKRAFS